MTRIIIFDIVEDLIEVHPILSTHKLPSGEVATQYGPTRWDIVLRSLLRLPMGSERPALEKGEHVKLTLETLR